MTNHTKKAREDEVHRIALFASNRRNRVSILFDKCILSKVVTSKEFGMATDSDQIYNISINPDEKEIVLDVTLHASFVIAFQQVWFIFRWYGQIIDEQIGNLFKRFDLFRK